MNDDIIGPGPPIIISTIFLLILISYCYSASYNSLKPLDTDNPSLHSDAEFND